MNMEVWLAAAICLLVGYLVGYLAGRRRAESDRWVRPAPKTSSHSEVAIRSRSEPQERIGAEDLPPEVMSEVLALLAQGKKISAIKLTREATGMGLKKSKDFVESLER